MDNYFNLANALNAHEGIGHFDLYLRLGFEKYKRIQANVREIYATYSQMIDQSWEYTTPGFKKRVNKYLEKQINGEKR